MKNSGGIPLRQFGRTNETISCIGLGGGNLCRAHSDEPTCIKLIQRAVAEGITFIDTAWDYDDGESERRLGKALCDRRDDVFLMTKVCGRDRATAESNLHDSLRRLQTDTIDLWQFHEINWDNDPEWVCEAGGALEAALAARDAGKIRYIGFTGHKSPHIHLKMLEQDFDWDSCQMPINIPDYHFRSFQREVLPVLNSRGIACLGMKSLGGGAQILRTGLTAQECRRYALSLPISCLICGIEDEKNLEQDLAIAREFVPYDDDELNDLRTRVAHEAGDGRHEWFKTTQYYDNPLHREQHGFPPIGHVSDE
ncbi:MAG: aldo/keto reductase [Planctomycetaceae bacterium]|nr:aldo/keto reductase [Planctomycetaceae bacterium]MCH2595884.1 aldo/keto reductase [Pirellulales bacterium]HCK40570.1 aldo/keto reductase [Planctomycetaceae bacterium]